MENGIFVISIKKSSKSNHQRYKTSVAFADFLIGVFVLPIVLVQRYYAAKLQLGSTINNLTVHDSKVVDPWRKPPFWFDDLGLNDNLIERKKVSFLSNYPELTQAVGVILFTSLFASNFSLLFSTFDMFVGKIKKTSEIGALRHFRNKISFQTNSKWNLYKMVRSTRSVIRWGFKLMPISRDSRITSQDPGTAKNSILFWSGYVAS